MLKSFITASSCEEYESPQHQTLLLPQVSSQEGKEVGRLLSSVIFETHSYYSPFSTLCAAGLTVDWGKTGHIHAMHDLLSYAVFGLPGKGPQRTVVQVVDCTRLPSKRKNGGCILHKRGHLFLIQQRLCMR